MASSATMRLNGTISAPAWIEQFGTLRSDGAKGVAVDQFGNVYVAGYTEGYFAEKKVGEQFINNDIFLVKYSNNGKELWRQQIGNISLQDIANAIAVDASGNVYVTGATYDALPASGGQGGYSDIGVAKFTKNGQFLWQKRFGSARNDSGRAIAIDASGYLYITGETEGYGSANLQDGDAFLSKLDGEGNPLWVQTLNFTSTDIGYDLAIDKNHAIYVAGTTGGGMQGVNVLDSAAFVTKYDASGNQVWAETFDNTDNANGINIDSSGNVYITGTTRETGFLSFKRDIYLTKLATDGRMLWNQRLNFSANDLAPNLAIDSQDNIYVTGQVTSTLFGGYLGSYDVLLSRWNTNGDLLGTHETGTMGEDIPNSVAVDVAGNIFVAGWTLGTLGETSQGYNDAFLIKYGNNAVSVPPDPTNGNTNGNSNGNNNNVIPGNTTENSLLSKNIKGTNRPDTLQGDTGNDTLTGLNGNDRISGLEGDDRLLGGSGKDRIDGGNGNDFLDGGLDNDRLLGGTGVDKFIIRKGRDIDVIQDFEDRQDRLATPRGIQSVEIDQVGRKTFIFAGNDVIGVLVGIQSDQITKNDFVIL